MADISFTMSSRNVWNAFRNKDPTEKQELQFGQITTVSPSRTRLSYGVDRTIVSSLYNRMALDVASVNFRHARLDENGRFEEEIDDELNKRLTISANIDQTAKNFIQDVCLTMFSEGVAAIVPVETDVNPELTQSFDILQFRVGHITEWYPEHIRMEVFDGRVGHREQIVMPKTRVAVIQNPFYTVMNERSSVVSRLTHKLSLLDQVDEQSASGKLDVLIQLPYPVKTDLQKQRMKERKQDIDDQLTDSKHGIAYLDATEKVIQLNRPVENNLLETIKYLTELLYNQLGISQEVFNGTAEEAVMLRYFEGTIEPIATEIALGMSRTFLSKTARTQGQTIWYYRDPFKLVPVSQIAEIADKFTRNEILSSNDVRAIMGYKPSKDPRADELRNKNLNADNDQLPRKLPNDTVSKEENK